MSDLLKSFFQPAKHGGESSAQPLGLVVRLAADRIIGRGGHIPWWDPQQHAICGQAVKEGALIVGRVGATALNLLPNRRRKILTVSRNKALHRAYNGREACGLLGDMLALARIIDTQMPLVIGGTSLFEQTLPQATRILAVSLARKVSGEHRFPLLDEEAWFQPYPAEEQEAGNKRLYVRKEQA